MKFVHDLQNLARTLNIPSSYIDLLDSFASISNFDRDTRAYERPMEISTGGLFGLGRSTYVAENDFEAKIFTILEQNNIVYVYTRIVPVVRKNLNAVRFLLTFLEKFESIRGEELTGFISDRICNIEQTVRGIVHRFVLNVVTVIRPEHIEQLRDRMHLSVDRMCVDLEEMIALLKEDSRQLALASGSGRASRASQQQNATVSSTTATSASSVYGKRKRRSGGEDQ